MIKCVNRIYGGSMLFYVAGQLLASQNLSAQETPLADINRVKWNLHSENPSDYKNVVLFFFDDMRFDCLGYAGGIAKTPNIDKLAINSCVFTNAISSNGICSPSRATLLTGRWGHRTGLDDNVRVWHSRLAGLSLDNSTILEWAREHGYFTGYFGKWHLGHDGPIRRGVHRFTKSGFDTGHAMEYTSVDFGVTRKYYEKAKAFKEKPEYYATLPGTFEQTSTFTTTSEGIEFLREANEMKRPFFLTMSFTAPHPPYKVPKPYNTMYDYKKIKLPASFYAPVINKPIQQKQVLWPWHDVGHMSEQDWQKTVSYFYGFVSMIDDAVKMVMDEIEKLKLSGSTLIIFTSDQGSMLADHGLYDKGPYSYEELMRIPMLLKVPGIEPIKVTRQVSLLDLNQTMVEWMGLEPEIPNIDSRSLFPLMVKGNEGWDIPDEAFFRFEWYNGKWFGVRTIRTPKYKYCYNTVDVDEFYDLQADPGEINNLYNKPEYREQQALLMEKLLENLKTTSDPLYIQMKTYMGNKSYYP